MEVGLEFVSLDFNPRHVYKVRQEGKRVIRLVQALPGGDIEELKVLHGLRDPPKGVRGCNHILGTQS